MAARAFPLLDAPDGRPAFLTPPAVLAFGVAVLVVAGAIVSDTCNSVKLKCYRGEERVMWRTET